MLSQIGVSVANGNVNVVGSVYFSVLNIVTLYIFFCNISDYGSAYADATLKMSTQNIETMLFTALGFPISKRVTDHSSILAPEAIGFSQELLPP